MKSISILSAAMALSLSPIASADFGLGLMATYSPNVYKGGDKKLTPFPLVNYDNGQFYIEGVEAGYRLMPKDSFSNVVIFAAYDPRTLDASESSDADIQKLDDRDSSFLGGIAYVINSGNAKFHLGAGTDIGSVHNGLYTEFKASYHIPMGAIGLIPAIGYSFNSDKLNDHLYGVSSAEAARTRFDEFNPNWSGRYFVGLSGYMYLSKHLRLTGGVRYENFDSEIEKSPIIDSSVSIMGNVGVSYTF